MTGLSRRAVLAGAFGGLALPALAKLPDDPWAEADAIAAAIRRPRFPDRRIDIADHGAKPDGRTLATAAIAAAIKACADAGGGRVVVPPGRFLTGAVRLRSNVELYLAEGATLLFSTDPSHYPLVHTRWEGSELINYSPLVYAYRERNVAITGKGTLDGQADASHWWDWRGTAHDLQGKAQTARPGARSRLVAMNAANLPLAQRVFGSAGRLRPPLVQFYDCDTVLIEDVRLRRSPFWQIHPLLSRNVTVRGVDIMSHGPNTDGCDPESCDGVLIEQVVFDTGDDCIAIKSGRNDDGRRFAKPSQNIVVRDCWMKQGHAGVAIGSEISGGVRNVFVERCRMDSPDLHYAFRFKNNAVRGGVLERLRYRDIEVGQVAEAAIYCDFNYEEGAIGPYTPVLRDVLVERMRVAKAARVIDAEGLPKAHIGDLTIRESRFDGVTQGSVVRFVDRLTLDHVTVNGHAVTRL